MKKILSIIFILLGLGLIFTPTIKEKLVKNKTDEINKIADEISYEDILKNQELEVEYNFESIEDVGAASVIFSSLKADSKNIIGQLKIPELEIELPLLKGLTNANLSAGVATMKDGQKMGQGNYSLSGHNMRNKNLLFGNLMEIEVGNKVYITDKNQIYEYEIYETIVVPDTSMFMIDDQESEKKGKAIISLMTCYKSSATEKRFFAIGELIDQYPMEEDNIK